MKAFLLLFLVLSLKVSAQVKFEKLSLRDAINKASTTGKLVLGQFESATCQQCNEVGATGLSSVEIGDSINARFIPIKIDVNHPDRELFISSYNQRQSHGTFFIAGNGELIHAYMGTTSNYMEYLTQSNKAIDKRFEAKISMNDLAKEWSSGSSNFEAMEAYIERRASVQLTTDSLLDIYVSRLPSDSSKSLRILKFVFKHAPPLFSKADAFLRQNEQLSYSAYSSFTPQEQRSIVERSRNKAVQKAIAHKDLNLIKRITNFGNVNPNPAFQRINDKLLLDYYVGTNDTANYLATAVPYYDRYFMNESAAQIIARDSLNRVRMMRAAGNNMPRTIDAETGIGRQTFSYAPQTQYYTRELNMGGWLIYTSTSDRELLEKATGWMQQAVAVYESPEALDTYARLLYKTGFREQAIEMQQKAIDILKQRSQNFQRYEAVLVKMKIGAAKID